jgi:hypothetical protein
LWIDSNTLKTKSLYLKLTQEGPDPSFGPPGDKISRWVKSLSQLQC